MTDPLVSVLIPTYNGERFLRAALRSALEQSYRNLEVVIGDDASTDHTPDILAEVAAADRRVRVIRHENNLGAFENPLQLLREARGEYVKFLLHDDVLARDCVRDLLRGMQSSPEASMAFSRRILIDENGRTRPDGDGDPLMDRPGLINGRELGNALLENCINIIGELTTVLFRRADVDPDGLWQVDGRRVDVLNDVVVWLRLLSTGPAFYTPLPLSRFRIHATQNTFSPAFVGRAERDWVRLVDWGKRHGYLSDQQQERRATAHALLNASTRVTQMIGTPHYGGALEAAFLATARLVELATTASPDRGPGLDVRAHDRPLLARFAQELDVWTREYPVALAAPAPEEAEIAATVRAFRDVREAKGDIRLVLAVPEASVDATVPLVEAALADGPDVDIDLVPADDPAGLLDGPWLAVVPRGASWHDGRAAAVWIIG